MENYGYVDDQDKSLIPSGGSNVEFGPNRGLIKKFEFNPNAGKDNSPVNALDFEVEVNGKLFKLRLFEVTKVFDKNGNALLKGEDGYDEIATTQIKQVNAMVIHIAKALGVTDNKLREAFGVPPKNFADFIKIATALPSKIEGSKVIVFLEYEFTIREGQERTWLILPKNMKGGKWIIPNTENAFEKVVTDGALSVIDTVTGEILFTRDKNYMESNKAKLQRNVETTTLTGEGESQSWE